MNTSFALKDTPDYIQFLGLITFVEQNSVIEAILPTIDVKHAQHIVAHQTMILFPERDAELVEGSWDVASVTILNQISGKEEVWQYVTLASDTVSFNRKVLEKARPKFLPQLKEGCCSSVGAMRDEYIQHGEKATHIVLPLSQLGLGQDPPESETARYDTVARLKADAEAPPLELTAARGSDVKWTLRFTKPAKIVIANFPLQYLKKPPQGSAASDQHPHFVAYYNIVHNGGTCGPDMTPRRKKSCQPSTKDTPKFELLVQLYPSDYAIRGADINCSNSTYP